MIRYDKQLSMHELLKTRKLSLQCSERVTNVTFGMFLNSLMCYFVTNKAPGACLNAPRGVVDFMHRGPC